MSQRQTTNDARARVQTFVRCWFALTVMLQTGWADAQSPDPSVEAGRKAFQEADEFPWYDNTSDDVARMEVKPRGDVEHRGSRWEWKERDFDLDLPDWLAALLEILMWGVIFGLLGFLVYLMVRAFMGYEGGAAGDRVNVAANAAGEVDRVESLPFQLRRPQTNLLEEAKRLYSEGRFSEAVIYLYSYKLLQLDKHHLIRLARGKTNRQYLREVRRRPEIRKLLEHTMIAFEDVFFGDHQLDRQRFETCWNSLDDFHQQLGPGAV